MVDTQVLSGQFRRFAERECKDSSILYEHLASQIADDPTLLELAAHSKPGQPAPNLLLGAVHYLLLQGTDHELALYYPSIVTEPKDTSGAFKWFKLFCEQYAVEITHLLRTKLVQTNEVRRCAYLYPSFCHIHGLTQKPLSLIEIGTSAGVQLLWDKYSYSYQPKPDLEYGQEHAALIIRSEIKGDKQPLFHKTSPPVAARIGIDLHVNNLDQPDDYLWLKSLIWPEHKERIAYFEAAADYLAKYKVELMEGDGVALLPEIISKISNDSTVCIFHTHAANQFPSETKIKLLEYIQELGKVREVFHLYNNLWDRDLHLDYYVNGIENKLTLAETDGHGRWFKWKL
ncbi:DUF2332 domain-containing protein [Paenibacillus glycanilyticus]|uniref:DUF2332 domain-containing protein n=1 Tax=Paenibacillus glycanilyticus TaxID=126569 RepID=UPI00203C250D|nr:DUF2332 domain-containing protein [Paenibacillus glycanilyticus]MCM3626640.1 DUF2332 domain-containing protein [Paenibacillus glycanilyticus]